jgi:hypothetical protein
MKMQAPGRDVNLAPAFSFRRFNKLYVVPANAGTHNRWSFN